MQIRLLRKSRTTIAGQTRKRSMGVNRRVLHYDYIYLTTLEDSDAFDKVDSILDSIEQECGQELFDIQSTYDDVAKLWTLRFACADKDLMREYMFDL